MSGVWYRVDYSWQVDIVPVKVQRSTDKMVVLENGYKEHKESSGRCYFADFDESVTFANERMAIKRRIAEREIVRVEKNETELWVSVQRIRDAIKDGVI